MTLDRPTMLVRSVLGLAMLGLTPARAVCDQLRDDHLDEPWRSVLAAVREVVGRDEDVTPLVVSGELGRAHGHLARFSLQAMDELTAEADSIGTLGTHCTEIRRHAAWRDRGRMLDQARHAAGQRDEEAWAQALTALDERDPAADDLPSLTGEQWAEQTWDWLNNPAEQLPTIATPWSAIDDGLDGGLNPGELVMVMGYSGHGKSMVASDLAHFAHRAERRVHMYLTEDAGINRASRVASRASGVPSWRIKRRALRSQDHRALQAGWFGRPTYGHSKVAGRSAQEICAHIRRAGWDLAIVDHMHDLAYRDERDLADIARAFLAEANRGRTCIVLCCQPSKAQFVRDTKRMREPHHADVKGAQAVADAMTTALMVHMQQEDDGTILPEGRLWVSKSRTGRYPETSVTANREWSSYAPADVLNRERMRLAEPERNAA